MVFAGIALPLFVVAIALGYLLVSRDRQAVLQGSALQAHALTTRLDGEMHRHVATLQALSSVSSLARDDLRAFHEDALRVLKSQPDWTNVILSLPDGRQIANPKLPYGSPLPRAAEPRSFVRAVQTHTAVMGALSPGALTGAQAVPVRVPVVQNGRTAYVLTAAVQPQAFQRLLADMPQGAAATVAILDGEGQVVVSSPRRAPDGDGSPVAPAALPSHAAGWHRIRAPDGAGAYAMRTAATPNGWSVALTVPQEAVDHAGRRTFGAVVIALQAALLFALLCGAWLRRGLSRT